MAKQQTLNGKSINGNGANLGFEQKLWSAADKMRNNMDAAEYKHAVFDFSHILRILFITPFSA